MNRISVIRFKLIKANVNVFPCCTNQRKFHEQSTLGRRPSDHRFERFMYFISILSSWSFLFHSFLLLCTFFFFNFIVIGCRLQFSVKYTPPLLDLFEDICGGDAYSKLYEMFSITNNCSISTKEWIISDVQDIRDYLPGIEWGIEFAKNIFSAHETS